MREIHAMKTLNKRLDAIKNKGEKFKQHTDENLNLHQAFYERVLLNQKAADRVLKLTNDVLMSPINDPEALKDCINIIDKHSSLTIKNAEFINKAKPVEEGNSENEQPKTDQTVLDIPSNQRIGGE